MDPKLLELIARLAAPKDGELANIPAEDLPDTEERLMAEATAAGEAKDVELLAQIVAALESIRGEIARREIEEAEKATQVAELMAKVTPVAETPPEGEGEGTEGEGEGNGEGTEGEGNETPARTEGVETPTTETPTQQIAASVRPMVSIKEINRRKATSVSPQTQPKSTRAALTAAADVGGYSAGQEIDRPALVAALQNRYRALMGAKGVNGQIKVPVASATFEYSEDRTLTGGDSDRDKILAVTQNEAVTAGAALCPPAQVDYTIFSNQENGRRTIRDSLPNFRATRGALTLRTPFALSAFDGAIGIQTVEDMENDTPKNVLIADCGGTVTREIEAITQIIQFKNLRALTDPEGVAEAVDKTQFAFERKAEAFLYAQIVSLTDAAITTAEVLGAIRDVLFNLSMIAARYRSFHGMAEDAILRWVAPTWLLNLLQADLAQQMPGDDKMVTALSEIRGYLNTFGVNPVFSPHIQVSGAQANGAANPWPSTVETLIYAEGTFLHMDGGQLDFGVVRDSTLNSTNDYQMFAESFENVHKPGNEALKWTMSLCASGLVSGQDDNGQVCAQAS